MLVALLPTAESAADDGIISKLHGVSAVLFFVGIGYVSLFRSRDTLDLLPPQKKAQYERWYFWTGLALVVSPLVAVVLSYVLRPNYEDSTLTFWAESLAVWAFAAYWLVKTREMRESEAEKHVLDAELERTVVPLDALDEADAQPMGAPPRPREKAAPSGRQVEKVLPARGARR